MTVRRFLLPLLLAAALLTACGGPGADDRAHLTDTTLPPTTEAPAETEASPAPVADEPPVTIARAATALDVLAEPEAGAPAVARLGPATSFGSPRALLVLDRQDGFVQVQVPMRPNGTTGWVAEGDVELLAGTVQVEVDLTALRLTVRDDDRVVLETPVAIGAPDAPTPTGTFAVIDRLQSPNPDGDYGPFAFGLSAFSETYSEFAGGDGQIGIHGTSDPTSIGQAVSHGCIRVPNDVAQRLSGLLPLGTPVTIA